MQENGTEQQKKLLEVNNVTKGDGYRMAGPEARTWGKHLEDLRNARGLTQAQVADGIEVIRERVNQWESESRQLKVEYVIMLADFYGVTCDELLRGVKAENANFHLQTGLSNKAIERLKTWQSKRERDPPKMLRARTHYETVLKLINMLICSPRIEQLAEHVRDYQQRLNGVIASMDYLIANPDTIERAPDPETGEPPNYEIFLGIDDFLLCEYKSKELFGEIMERYAKHRKHEVRQRQDELIKLVGRDYQVWKGRDIDGANEQLPPAPAPTASQPIAARERKKASRGTPRKA